MENFNPTRRCYENEHKCTNSYGYKICVDEKAKNFACAKYSKKLCDDEKTIHENINRILMIYGIKYVF